MSSVSELEVKAIATANAGIAVNLKRTQLFEATRLSSMGAVPRSCSSSD